MQAMYLPGANSFRFHIEMVSISGYRCYTLRTKAWSLCDHRLPCTHTQLHSTIFAMPNRTHLHSGAAAHASLTSANKNCHSHQKCTQSRRDPSLIVVSQTGKFSICSHVTTERKCLSDVLLSHCRPPSIYASSDYIGQESIIRVRVCVCGAVCASILSLVSICRLDFIRSVYIVTTTFQHKHVLFVMIVEQLSTQTPLPPINSYMRTQQWDCSIYFNQNGLGKFIKRFWVNNKAHEIIVYTIRT